MKKRELEQLRQFKTNGQTTQSLAKKASIELNVVKDAYDVAGQMIEKIEILLSQQTDMRGVRMSAAALKDAVGALVALRAEARDSVNALKVEQTPVGVNAPLTSAPSGTVTAHAHAPENANTNINVAGEKGVQPAPCARGDDI